MSKKPTIVTVDSGWMSNTQLTTNLEALRDAFDNTLSLDGSTPNAMNADLDMNGNDILNVGELNVASVSVAGSSLSGTLQSVATQVAADAATASAAATAAQAAENSLLEWQGPWLTATAYAPSDLVSESGNTYVCLVSHTSGTFATDLGAGNWEIFAAKGATGAGTGDVLASNNGSEFTPTTFRSNLQVPARLTASVGTNDFDSDYDSRETSVFQVASTPLNGPTGGVAGDWVSWFRTDSNNIRAVWHLADGNVAYRTKVSGTWGDWILGINEEDLDENLNLTAIKGFLNAGGSAPVYACRAWGNFNGTGTPAFRASGNCSSITDNGSGLYRINFTTAMPDNDYSVVITSSSAQCRIGTMNTDYFTMVNENDSGNNEDSDTICFAVFR